MLEDPGPLARLLDSHLSRYPAMQLNDLYKLLHQAAMGAEHAVQDEQAARERLELELAEMGAGPDDPLFDPLTPDGSLVRVHLRPYLAAGRDPQALLEAFIRTAHGRPGSTDDLDRSARLVVEWAGLGRLPFDAQLVADYFVEKQERGFPAVHHSEAYRACYRPAYRVAALRYLEGG